MWHWQDKLEVAAVKVASGQVVLLHSMHGHVQIHGRVPSLRWLMWQSRPLYSSVPDPFGPITAVNLSNGPIT